eukprot:CAMPEP_0196655206 /NCGR_PEP_ID=MMETSP1086-20130531/4953_1 /TAXON_ID=77921 /ORGANISM="Cyanoptyche  gloeocystis , Strain SAG4.97" /LENGTH=165 /DNA_ID=CAMNT_0041987387 /DNA_START=230 /DNA_END=728 /DNA_ORIENTATION=+
MRDKNQHLEKSKSKKNRKLACRVVTTCFHCREKSFRSGSARGRVREAVSEYNATQQLRATPQGDTLPATSPAHVAALAAAETPTPTPTSQRRPTTSPSPRDPFTPPPPQWPPVSRSTERKRAAKSKRTSLSALVAQTTPIADAVSSSPRLMHFLQSLGGSSTNQR